MKESSFFKTNDRLVNLHNVSNINFLNNSNRVVFNLNYHIELSTKPGTKLISDYVYLDGRNSEDYDFIVTNIINNEFIQENFLLHPNGYININEISSVKFSDKKLRVIFNLSHPITFIDEFHFKRITSEFVYVDFDEVSEYKEFVKRVKDRLG